jgi:hypothetical protein
MKKVKNEKKEVVKTSEYTYNGYTHTKKILVKIDNIYLY